MTTLRLWLVGSVLLLFGGMGGLPLYAQQSQPEAIGRISTSAISPKVVQASQEAVHGADRTGKDGPMVKVGRELALIYHQHRVQGRKGIRQLRQKSSLQKRARSGESNAPVGRVLSPLASDGRSVTIEATATAETAAPLLADLRRLGLENGSAVGRLVSGRLPISALRSAAQLQTLRGMMPSYARSHVGAVESEADTAHATVSVREEMGVDGSGQKICALSDSYDQAGDPAAPSASDDVQTGDLPGDGNPEGNTTPVDVLNDGDTGGTDEGRAMLQLIHDMAPGATLGFASATASGLSGFVNGIRNLADPSLGDCDVIVDDIGYNIEPFYQDGPVTNVINEVVENEDVVYFSSAGNDGQNAYHAPFRNSGQQGLTSPRAVAHDFDPGSAVDTKQQITISPGGEFGFFTFQWTDPSVVVDGSRGPDTDIDVALVNDTSGIVAESLIPNIEDGRPFESLDFTNEGNIDTDGDGVADSTFHLVIEKFEGPDPEEVRYIYSGSNYSIDEYDTLGATIYGHPMAEKAMAVAAAPFFYTSAYSSADPAVLESFSSKGGIPIRFDQSGNSISPVSRDKPDVTGTDGIDNTFFGNDIPDAALSGVDADPHPNFFGTSAAAPNIAAIAGLIRQARPALSSEDVYGRLRAGALDVTQRVTRAGQLQTIGSGRDPWSGEGFVQAEEAVPPVDVFDLQLSLSGATSGLVELSWRVRSGVTIQEYNLEQRYFSGPFELLDVSVENETALLGNLGLGVYTFRVGWTRDDGITGQRVYTDTLGFQSVDAEVTARDEQRRGTVSLSWTVPQGTQNVTYEVERRIAGEERPFRPVGTTEETQLELPRQLPGSYAYRVTAADNQGNTLKSPVRTLDVALDGEAVAVGPYPNPVQGDVATVDLSVQNTQRVTVEVFNTIGERIYQSEPRVEALAPEVLRLNVSEWGSGVYFFRVQGEDFTRTRKLVVVK